jgi:hypothetical protein
MKKWVVLAALMSLLTALGVSSTFAGAAVTPANGNDFVLPDGTVYELDADGVFHLIPNVATGNAMHLNWNAMTPVDSIDGDVGDPFPSVAVLTNARGAVATGTAKVAAVLANGSDFILPDGSVYQLDADGVYHLVPDVATGNAMHLSWNALQLLDALDSDVGNPFPSVTG